MKISLQDFFLRSFYITIDSGRAQEFKSVFNRVFTFFDKHFPRVFWGFRNKDLTPQYCCALSHVSIVKLAKSLSWPFVVLFEDDAYPCADIEEKLANVLADIPDFCKIAILGYNKFGKTVPCNKHFSLLKSYCWGTHAYMIFENGYDDYLRLYNADPSIPADWRFEKLADKTVVSSENLFIQRCVKKSMNGYHGYIYDNQNKSDPPAGFYDVAHITMGVNGENRLLEEIMGLGHFIYRANGGNAGDFLISSAEQQLFSRLGLGYTQVFSDNKKQVLANDFNLVYGGGGGWVKNYSTYYARPKQEYFKNPRLKRCIVLPSTFFACDDVIDSFDERFVVFCRDERSFEYCVKRNHKAAFYLHDDLALSLDVGKIGYEEILSVSDVSHPRIQKAIEAARNYKISNSGDTAYLLRTDGERTSVPLPAQNFDISKMFDAHGESVRHDECDQITAIFLNVINEYETIVTNRLHVMIAAHLLGKKIEVYDNSYGKLSAVYKMSLGKDGNIKTYF